MQNVVSRTFRPVYVAVLSVAGAVLLRLALEPVVAGTQVWLTFWPAVFVAAWYGGARAGVITIVLSAGVVAFWFGETPYLDASRGLLGGSVFASCGVGFCWVVARHQRVREREHQVATRHRALVELATLLSGSRSLEEVAFAVVSEGKRAPHADTAMLYVHDESSHSFRLIAEQGCAPEVVEKIRVIDANSEHGAKLKTERWVGAREQYAAVLPDVAAIRSDHRRAVAWWSMPLEVAGQCVGVMAMGFYDAREFDDDEREFVRLFAGQCAQAVARAERTMRLERANRRLERLFDSNLIGTVFWADGGRIVRANDTFLRSIGYTPEELDAGLVDWRTLTPPEHAAADRAAVDAVRTTGAHPPYEKEFIHKDGRRVPLLVASAAFVDDPRQGVTYLADLTHVKQAAEAANRAKDEFLAMLGHELRNPLAPITTALELIEMRGVERVPRAIEIIRRQVGHMSRMVDDLLDVSRIVSGKIEIEKRRIELRDVVSRASEMVSPLFEERRHTLQVDVDDGHVIDGDITRLTQVVANILTNAGKYTDAGGTVAVRCLREHDAAVLEISDNGIGIDATLLPRVFDLFTQEPQSVARSRGGLGLGLAIARTLVELHGGTMSANSEGRGRGTTVRLRIPYAASTSPSVVQPRTITPSGASRRRVLVVDDNRDAAEMLSALAEHRGHTTRHAPDATLALALLDEFSPDVALLDLGLPVIDGFELARRIRQHPRHRAIRLVAVTGYGQSADRQRSSAAGFDGHLVKPVQVDEVLHAIEATTNS